jgi:hypothetical protein
MPWLRQRTTNGLKPQTTPGLGPRPGLLPGLRPAGRWLNPTRAKWLRLRKMTRRRSGMKPLPKPVAETTEDAGAKTKQDVRTASKEGDVTVNICNFQKLGTEQLESNSTRPPLFSIRSKPSPPKRAIIQDGRWRAALLSLQNCSERRVSRAPFRSGRNMPIRLMRASSPM